MTTRIDYGALVRRLRQREMLTRRAMAIATLLPILGGLLVTGFLVTEVMQLRAELERARSQAGVATAEPEPESVTARPELECPETKCPEVQCPESDCPECKCPEPECVGAKTPAAASHSGDPQLAERLAASGTAVPWQGHPLFVRATRSFITRRNDRPLYAVRLSIDGSTEGLAQIASVAYDFDDPSFNPREKLSDDRESGFMIEYKGYGCVHSVDVKLQGVGGEKRVLEFPMCRVMGWVQAAGGQTE